MKTFMLTAVGLLLAGAVGGTQISAQGFGNNRRQDRKEAREDRRDGRKEAREDRHDARHDHGRRQRVWIEDYVMVEEHYETPGYWTTVEKKVWVPEKHVKVHEDVWVPAHTVTKKEARRDRHGCIYYVDVRVTIPGRYECREVVKCIPGHYTTVCERVYVKGECKTRLVKKVTGGHWEWRNC